MIVLSVFYAKTEIICSVYGSKQNSKSKKKVILLMISNVKGWQYLAVEN